MKVLFLILENKVIKSGIKLKKFYFICKKLFFLLNSKSKFFINYYIYSEYNEVYFRNTYNI